MGAKRLSVEDVREDGAWKFVRLGDEYRFCDNMDQHRDLVGPGEKADAAGTFFTFKGNYVRLEGWSHGLQLGYGDREKEDLARMIGLPVKGRFE